jgi:hypothetical protein
VHEGGRSPEGATMAEDHALHSGGATHGEAEARQGEYDMRQVRTPVPRLGLVPTAAAQEPRYTPLGNRTPLGARSPPGQHEVPRVRLRSDRASLTRFFRWSNPCASRARVRLGRV